jgi:hypothetical protein
MTLKEVRKILLHHGKNGFNYELKDLTDKIEDLKGSNTGISSFVFKLAVPQNRGNTSTVEVSVMKNLTVADLEEQAKDIKRFINKLNWSIDNLPTAEKNVICARYLSDEAPLEFRYVASKVNFSEDWCERLDKRALNTIAENLCGIKIVWNS